MIDREHLARLLRKAPFERIGGGALRSFDTSLEPSEAEYDTADRIIAAGYSRPRSVRQTRMFLFADEQKP